MKILVCGGRKFGLCIRDIELLQKTLDSYDKTNLVIVHGAAAGADSLAGRWALENDVSVEEYPALWSKYGRYAGIERNERMLLSSNPDLVIAFPGGTGTAHMKRFARSEGYAVLEIVAE
jgi:hypothetical protein